MRQQQKSYRIAQWAAISQPDRTRLIRNVKEDTNTKRRIEIIVEKHRVLTLRTRRTSAVGWCRACSKKVHMVTAEDASRIARVTPRAIYRRVETGQLHFTESHDGMLLICVKSLG